MREFISFLVGLASAWVFFFWSLAIFAGTGQVTADNIDAMIWISMICGVGSGFVLGAFHFAVNKEK